MTKKKKKCNLSGLEGENKKSEKVVTENKR